MKTLTVSIALAGLLFGAAAVAGESPSPKGAYLYIGWPNDGEVIRRQRFRIWFGLRRMGVAPAGSSASSSGSARVLSR